MTDERADARITGVLSPLEIPTSSWYRKPIPEAERRRPGPKPRAISEEIVQAVLSMATGNPWYGYQRIAVMCRREDDPVKDRQAYRVMKDHDLLHKRRPYKAEVYQASKLYELLPQKPNELWQMDVTYIYLPGYGWHYAITVIDYYSRYLLACKHHNGTLAFSLNDLMNWSGQHEQHIQHRRKEDAIAIWIEKPE